MKKVALLGADGQLGSDLVPALASRPGAYELHPLTLHDFDVRDPQATAAALEKISPDIVVNTTAFVRVDDCEEQAQQAFDVNAVAVQSLVRICTLLNARLVHFGTDYVFGGDSLRTTPYTERDRPAPQSIYAVSKLAGELVVLASPSPHLVVRSCGLYGKAGSMGKGTNFVETMLKLAEDGKAIRVVGDQRLTPTSTVDLAAKVVELLDVGASGLFHLTNSGDCTWHEFAAEIFALTHTGANLSPVDTATYGAKARRPAYSVLRSERLADSGLAPMQSWQQALTAYLQRTGRL